MERNRNKEKKYVMYAGMLCVSGMHRQVGAMQICLGAGMVCYAGQCAYTGQVGGTECRYRCMLLDGGRFSWYALCDYGLCDYDVRQH